MKKLNYSWKVAGFALLFGLSMGLQSCDQVIDNPLSPVQPVPDTPATPATPKATVAGTTITIENCADTKDVNGQLATDAVKDVFAKTATLDSLGNEQTIEIIVKGGIKIADAIAIPKTAFGPHIQLTFADAFTEAKSALTIKNNEANAGRFTVKLPDSESPINLDLSVNDNVYWPDNVVTGNAVLGGIKTTCTDTLSSTNIKLKDGIKINAYDGDAQTRTWLYMNDNAIDAVVLNGGKDGSFYGFTCYKRGFRAARAYGDDDEIYAKNAIIAEGTAVSIWPSTPESKANTITIQKNAQLRLAEETDDEITTSHYTANINAIVGADRSAQFTNSHTESYARWDGNGKQHNVIYNIGSLSNVTIPNWWWDYLPSNVSNVTFGTIDNGACVLIPSSMKSISGIDFNCQVRIDLAVAETGMGQFTFENTNFGASSNTIGFVPESDIYLKDASGNVIYVTVYVWKDKDGVIHTDTTNPQGNAKFDSMINQYERPAYDTVKYEDFKAYLSFVGCKVDGKDLDSKLLSPMVYQQDFGAGSKVIYQIGYNSNYRLSDSGVLVAF